MSLPSLSNYRNDFLKKGIHFPLKKIPIEPNGLLTVLPPAPQGKQGWPWTIQTDPQRYQKHNNWPKITIVTPSYNQAKFIEETIRAVLLQNYPNLEFIVIDGGSTDNTSEILAKYSPWISYWQSEKDNGQGHAINLGFSLASGDYYGWVNSDDYYNKDAFYQLATSILKTKKDFYYGNSDEVLEDGSYYKFWQANQVKNRFLRYGGLISSHAAFWSKGIHVPILEDIYCAMDYELWMRLAKNVKRKHVNYTLATVRQQAMAKSHHKDLVDKWAIDKKFIDDLYKLKESFLLSRVRIYEYKYYQMAYKFFTKKRPKT